MRARIVAVIVGASLVLGSITSGLALPEDAITPIEDYTTTKGRALAQTYRAELMQFSDHIYHCLPWLGVVKNGIGFRQPKGAQTDDRYLSVWISIDQADDGQFGKLPVERRVSAMFSRYGVDMLRRMTQLKDVVADGDVYGFSVILSWLKPGNYSADKPPITETLALFIDKTSLTEFLAKRLPVPEFANRAKFNVFEGRDPIGRVPLDVWDDNFNSTFKLKNYELEKGKKC